jgi:hypothetical protein
VFKEGETSNNFYLIIKGEAEAHKLVDGCNNNLFIGINC